jgi:DNA-binding NarL/FixJ family response regulator
MAPADADLERLWQRVENARREWLVAHKSLSGAAPSDGPADELALSAENVAVRKYLRALRQFQAALARDRRPGRDAGRDGITPREREILALIASGKSSKQIAAKLGIAFRTTVCHRYRLYQKLQVHTNVELTRKALDLGLIEL